MSSIVREKPSEAANSSSTTRQALPQVSAAQTHNPDALSLQCRTEHAPERRKRAMDRPADAISGGSGLTLLAGAC